MVYGIVVDSSGFVLSAYGGPGPLPDGFSGISEELYLQIMPGSSYVNGAVVPPVASGGPS